ncbi:hypothetical protein LOD99_1565 [Oopsacas minuta]|uniref:FLYWCH-type domain-containing protein n=1 Tax=Oopsacas minuta TaxID=111878 RepID=A0AAV7K4Q2_9METZ|nr:hypothetical protein LOD99_1565 [Oopsacas minuta]
MHRRVGEMTHWQCEKRGKCKARVHTKGMEIVKRMNEHLHVPDVQATACCGIKVGIKRETRDTHDSSQCIIGEGMLTASEGTAAKLPPVQPTALAELFLPAEYQRTAKEEQFLLYNSGEDDAHRFLIFGTQRTLGMLQQSKIWLADGTFKTAPPSSPKCMWCMDSEEGTIL